MPAPADDLPTKAESAVTTQIYIDTAKKTMLRSLDLFFFNDDALRRLDTYQRIEDPGETVTAASRNGDKILVAIANYPQESRAWSDINAYAAVARRRMALTEEDPDFPILAGEVRVRAGSAARCTLPLTPLMAQVRLQSVCCDFHGKPYEGARLEHVKVYLTNVCGETTLLGDGAPASWLNSYALDTAGMARPELLFADLPGGIGDATLFPDIRLYAYANPAEQETAGQPYTRLVIEGDLDGRTCYYPININQTGAGYQSGHRGIERGTTYALNVAITQVGTDGPDQPALSGAVRIDAAAAPWTAKDPATIRY